MADDGDAGEWIAVGSVDRLGATGILPVHANGLSLIVVRNDDRFYACERACPHEQADLAEGHLANGKIHCPRHRACFDLSSGIISRGWSSRPLHRYPVRVENGTIWINLG